MAGDRNTFKSVYDRAVLSSFTQKEFDFAKSGNADIVQKNNTDFTIVNRDSSGNITGYSYKNLPGLTSDGKPTEETTNFLLNNGKLIPGSFPGAANTRLEITINGKKTEMPISEVGSIIRERHGMSSVDKESNFYGRGSRLTNANNDEMAKYVKAHDDARLLIQKANEISKQKQKLIDDGILIRVEEEIIDENGVVVGTGEQWIYRNEWKDSNGNSIEGTAFDDKTPIIELMNQLGIGPDSKNVDPERAMLIGFEFDQLCSGYLTRNPKDGSRIDKNSNVSGGPTLDVTRSFPPTGESSQTGPIYAAKVITGYTKKGLQGAVVSGILGGFVQNFLGKIAEKYGTGTAVGLFAKGASLTAHKLHHIEHSIAGHNIYSNKLIWVKTLYGGFALIKGDATLYNNPITPWAIHAAIHFGAPFAARLLAKAGLGVTTGGLSVAMELIWIAGEWGYEWYNAGKKEEEEKKQNEERWKREAISMGCLIPRYVQSEGKACIKSKPTKKYFPFPPPGRWEDIRPTELTDDNQLPIGVVRDKNGNIVYEPDPTQQGLPSPKYIYPTPKPATPPPPNSGPATPRRLNPEDPRDQSYKVDPSNAPGSNTNYQSPLSQPTLTATVINSQTGEREIIGFTVQSHNSSKEAEYLGIITANYVAAKNTSYVSELLNVTTLSNDPNLFQNQSANAGPIYNAASPADQITNNRNPVGDNPYAEIEASKQRDRELQEKDKYWLGLLYSGGSSRGGDGNGGGGTLPPHENATLDSSAMPIAGVPNVFMLDMGYDILYYYDGYATLIPKVDRPTIQYSSDGMG